jgi:hypothetical protein
MSGDAADFATLGLEPGADRASVERAYRRLIKHHHPDREGGDAARASEITRAYRELREQRLHGGLEFHEPFAGAPARFGGGWLIVILLLASASLALISLVGGGRPVLEGSLAGTARSLVPGAAKRAAEPMQQPIDEAAVAGAIADARRIALSGDEMALTSESRDCHDRFRDAPRLALLDRCAAFDDAVAVLQDRDPLRDRGAFSGLAVTSRQWSAAKRMSGDVMAIDGRLDQIRLKVELSLASSAPPPR